MLKRCGLLLCLLAATAFAQDLRERYATRSLEAAKAIDEGIRLVREKRPAEAIPHLKKAVQLDRECHMALYWLANAQHDIGEIDEALVTFQKLLDASPRGNISNVTIEGCIDAGITLGTVGREAEASAWFSRAILLDPTNRHRLHWKAYRNMTITWRNTKKPLSAAICALLGYMSDRERVEADLVQDLIRAAESAKDEGAQILDLPAESPLPPPRKVAAKLEPVEIEGAAAGNVLRIVPDAAGRRVLVLVEKADHYLALDPSKGNAITKIQAPGPVRAIAVAGDRTYLSVDGPARLVQVKSDGTVAKTWPLPVEAPWSVAVAPAQGMAAFPFKGVLHSLDLDSGEVTKSDFGANVVETDPEQRFCYAFVKPDPRHETGHVIIDGRPVFFSATDNDWLQSTLYRFAWTEKRLLLAGVRVNAASNAFDLHVSQDGRWAALAGGGGWRPENPGPHKAGYVVAVVPAGNFTSVQGTYSVEAYPRAVAINPVTGQIAVAREKDVKVYALGAAAEPPVVLPGRVGTACAWSADGRFLYAGGSEKLLVFRNELSKDEEAAGDSWARAQAARVAKLAAPVAKVAEVQPLKELASFKIAASKAEVIKAIQRAEREGRTTKPVGCLRYGPYVEGDLGKALNEVAEKINGKEHGVATYKLKQLQAKHPDHPVINCYLGSCYWATKQFDKAEAPLLAWIRADQGRTDISTEALRVLAYVRFDQDDALGASWCAAHALLLDVVTPVNRKDGAMIFKKAGLENEAKKLLEKGGGPPPGPGGMDKPAPLPKAPEGSPMKGTDLYRKIAPSVVKIQSGSSTGSGVCVGQKGWILTNAHVIRDSRGPAEVQTFGWDGAKLVRGKSCRAEVVLVSENEDLAILRMEEALLDPVPVADREPAPGEKVFAIGSPGLGSQVLEQSISEGIVSSGSRQVQGAEYLQHTAAVNPGNSGGPLLDEKGQVIGLVTLKAKLENVSFAVPAKVIRALFSRPR